METKNPKCLICGTNHPIVTVERLSFCRPCANKLLSGLSTALNARPLNHGDVGWYVNVDEGVLECARVDQPNYRPTANGPVLESFGLDFAMDEKSAKEGLYNDYDVFDGSCFQSHFFLDREKAEEALWAVTKK